MRPPNNAPNNVPNNERFLRSLGIINESQLEKIRNTKIAVAGLGLGGSIFLNLVRMGFEKFHIADPDTFERTNINRQRLAKENSLGRRKDDMSVQEALAINPNVSIQTFTDGVRSHNLEQFLEGIDWVVDVVDVFALPEKMALHAESRKRDIPVISCATLGFSGSVIVFNNRGPSFAELTGMDVRDSQKLNLQKFIQFIAPSVPEYMYEQLSLALDHSTYIPFVVPGGEISAAFCTTEVVKNILNIGMRVYAPRGLFIDSFNLNLENFEASHLARGFGIQNPIKQKKKAA